jgi:hypothetical protein
VKSPGETPRAFFVLRTIEMGIRITLNKGLVPVKVWTKDIEHEAIQQLVNV